MAMVTEHTTALVALVVGIVLTALPASAGTVYRWTDARGVVHFSDVPPPNTTRFQAETLPDVPVPVAQPPAPAVAAAEDSTPQPVGTAPPGEAKAPSGPARVVVTDQQAEPVGPAVQSFRGKVKNQGGAEARDVVIALVVTETTQGDECLREEIDVEPPTLAPGAEGTFEAEFENPCFHGPISTDLQVDWR